MISNIPVSYQNGTQDELQLDTSGDTETFKWDKLYHSKYKHKSSASIG